MSSSALLSVLMSIGIAVIAVLWGLNEGRRGGGGGGEDAVAEARRLAEGDITTLQEQLDRARDEIEGLKDENRTIRRELTLEKESVADVLKANDRLMARLDSHMAGGQAGADGRDWTDKEIDLRHGTESLVVNIREMKLPGPLGYRFVDWEGMRAALAKRPEMVSEASAGRQSEAYAAMGFVPPGTDVRARMLDFLEAQLGAALYDGDAKMLFHTEGTTQSIHDRTALATEVLRYALDGKFGLGEKFAAVPSNGDARAALKALATGDASLVKIRFQLQDTSAAASDDLLQSPTKMTREQFERIPAFLREELLFPYALGERFVQTLHEKGGWPAIDGAYRDPPFTTTEILHPELFSLEKPFEAEAYTSLDDKLEIDGVTPLWDDVAGELRIALQLNQASFLKRMTDLGQPDILDMPDLVSKGIEHFSERAGSRAAAGWAGDRYFVYPTPGGGESVCWRSKWSSADDAAEFATAIGKSLAFRHKVELQDGGAWSTGGTRAVKVLRLGESEVLVIDAASADFGKALEGAFGEGGGE